MKLLLAAALAITLSAARQTPAPVPPPETHARAVVTALTTGDFPAVEAQYDAAMKAALPPGGLKTSWATGALQFGAFESITAIRTQQAGPNTVALVDCRFAQVDVTLRVVFNAAGELAGLTAINPVSRTPWAPPDYVDPSAFEARPITLHPGDWALPGIVTVPKAPGVHPAVVLVHGSGPNDVNESIGPNRMFEDLAEGLASRGIIVLRFEKRTHKYGAASSTDPATFTVKDEEMDDASAAVALLDSMPEVNRARVYLAGHSEGGYLAPRIAAGNPAVKGVILLAGNIRTLDALIVEQVRYQAGLAGPTTPAIQQTIDAANASAAEWTNPALTPGMTVHVLGASVPASYVLDLRTYHPAEVAAALTIPILVLQGERDYQVTMTDFALWQKALGSRSSATFKSYPALNHFFFPGTGPSRPAEYLTPSHVDRAVITDLAAWCTK
jgi:alpha-beta hydrolase superfamily lysophospholipase